MIQKPTHVYVGRNQCGCCTAIISVIPGDKKETGRALSEVIASGRYANRVTWQHYVDVVSNESTFMACSHTGQPNNAIQAELLPVDACEHGFEVSCPEQCN